MHTKLLKSTLFKGSLLALSLFLQLPVVALADESSPVQSPAQMQSDSGANQETVLRGKAKILGDGTSPMDGSASAPGGGTALDGTAEEVQLKAATPTLDESKKFELSATKLSSGADMTPEDFRNLGIGTLGLSAHITTFDRYPKVEAVFAGSPAEQAGIQVGDLVVKNDSLPNQRPSPWDGEKWKFHFDHAGTQAHLTIKHGHETQDYTLTRMNIEDLPDPKVRKIYEEQARKMGGESIGTVTTGDRPRGLRRFIP